MYATIAGSEFQLYDMRTGHQVAATDTGVKPVFTSGLYCADIDNDSPNEFAGLMGETLLCLGLGEDRSA
jgi:hypothetical protein